ncbi:MAG: NifB/NifX family molybdenum-iron cluster-binding protein [Anaerolineales bacterium]|nr:NifB/NifX family molybdenum-iron cluster-binding protein [Anaerolineales bacterium]
MRIAVITDDGQTISQHFGRAAHYLVATVEDGKIVQRELRDKLGHNHFAAEGHGHEAEGQLHGHGPAADNRHGRMAQAIDDCEAVLCGGMGSGAYQSMRARGIRPVVTDLTSIDEAVLAFAAGTIVDHVDRLH